MFYVFFAGFSDRRSAPWILWMAAQHGRERWQRNRCGAAPAVVDYEFAILWPSYVLCSRVCVFYPIY